MGWGFIGDCFGGESCFCMKRECSWIRLTLKRYVRDVD